MQSNQHPYPDPGLPPLKNKMSFFTKLRKKRGAEEPKQTPQPPKEVVEQTAIPPTPDVVENEPPGHAVEMESSIFSGLLLSGKVTTQEDRNSPYLQRKPEPVDSEPTSSFTFLHDKPDGSEPDEDGGSSFDFLKSEPPVDNEQTGSGFSFLNQEPESHDTEQRSRDESHDSLTNKQSQSIDQLLPTSPREESHDQAIDNLSIASDRTSDSAHSEGRTVAHMVPKQQPPSSSGKKKKRQRRAMRPGQETREEPHSESLLIEELSIPTSPSHEQFSPTTIKESKVKKATNEEDSGLKVAKASVPVENISHEVEPERPNEEKHTGKEEPPLLSPEQVTENSTKDFKDDTLEEDHMEEGPDDKETETQELVNLSESEQTQEQSTPLETVNDDLADVFKVESANYKVELSAQEELVTLLESFECGLQKIRLGVEQAKEEHKLVLDEQISLTHNQIERREKVKELKEQEAKSLLDEDYELAEKLSHQLEETQLFHEDKIVEICLQEIEKWMVKCCEVAESEMSFRKDIHNQLTSLKSEHAKALSELEKELSSLQAKEKMRLKAMEDKIERERGHIALDREHLEKSEQGLSEELNRRAAGFISSKEQLQEHLKEVETEISELELKLADLRSQRSEIEKSIVEEEEKIQTIQIELAQEHSELYAERQQIEQRESQLTKEVDKFTLECNEVEAVHSEQERKKQSLMQVVDKVDTQCSEYAGMELSLSQCNKVLESLMPVMEKGKSLLKPSPKLNSILEQCANKSKEVDEITTQLLASQAELSSLRKKVVEWETQLPQLNDAKKAAVTGRQFKEASRLAGEIKEVSSSLETEKANVSTMEEKLSTLNKQLSLLSDELGALKEQANTLEKEEDEQHIEHLQDASKEIRSQSTIIENTALYEATKQWCQLNQLLCVSLSAKHGLDISSLHPEPAKTESATAEQSIVVAEEVPEERTPGVGMEDTSEDQERKEELKLKLTQIEADIKKACDEEDYDKAAQLDEDLKVVQKELDEL